jgi:hypothetical protein
MGLFLGNDYLQPLLMQTSAYSRFRKQITPWTLRLCFSACTVPEYTLSLILSRWNDRDLVVSRI